MNSDSSSVPTPPEGEWSDIDGAAPSGLPRVPLPTYPDQYSATSRRESLASSSSSIPTPPEGEWSDANDSNALDPLRMPLPPYHGSPNTLIFLIHSGLVPYMESITIFGK